jgi:ABC-type branched-subunit amino acid transport system ATPase component
VIQLEVAGLSKSFGGVKAVDNVSFLLPTGTVKSLIGPNGAGKTTCFNLVTGVYAPDAGRAVFGERTMTGALPNEVATLGVGRTFQHPRLFRQMTVLDNVMAGCHRNVHIGYFGTALGLPGPRRAAAQAARTAEECLDQVGLLGLAHRRAEGLSTGQEKLLELARVLAMKPGLLLLDEPAAGLNDTETAFLAELIVRFRRSGLTILVVEHNMDLVMSVSDSVTVLNYGKVIAEGTPHQVQNDPAVLEAYLGEQGLAEQTR